MNKILVACTAALLIMLMFFSGACSTSNASQAESLQIAEEFVKVDTTYQFDGIPDTLKLTLTTSIAHGWKFTFEFDSSHAGYGNRNGQILAQVITHHAAVITVEAGEGTSAIMDSVWDMRNNSVISDITIDPAPIHEVNVTLLKSNPAQVSVYIKGGLRDGCTTFYNIEVTREGNTVNIKVTTKHPKEAVCPAIYTYFEKNVNLGTDFTIATTYTLNVNDYTTTFTY
jgi:hypothetical protein